MNQMEEKRKRYTVISSMIMFVSLFVLTGFVGEHGAGYLAGSFELFFLVLLLAAYTLPEAESRLLRVRIQKGQSCNARRVLKVSFLLGIFYSIAGSLLLFFGSDFLLERLLKVSYGAFTLKLLIPGYVLFVFAQVLRGYFQGMGSYVPTGVSKMIGNVIWVITGFIFCFIFKNYGDKVAALLTNEEFTSSFASAGAAAGFDLAMLFVLLFLLFVYQTNKRNLRTDKKEAVRMSEGIGEIFSMLAATMLPVIACGFLSRVTILGGMALYQHAAGNTAQAGIGVCGAFYGKYFAVTMLLVMLLRLPFAALEGMILNGCRKEEYKYVREKISWGVHYLFVHGAFLTVLMAVLGDTLLKALFKADSGQAGAMFMTGSSLILFVPLTVFFTALLNGIGKRKMVSAIWLAGAGIFFGCGVAAVNLLHAGMKGITASLCISWMLMACIGGFLCMRFLKWKPEWVYQMVLPVGTAALMGILLLLLNKALVSFVGGLLSFLICFVFGMFGNFILLLALRGIRREELVLYPGGKILVKFAEVIRLL